LDILEFVNIESKVGNHVEGINLMENHSKHANLLSICEIDIDCVNLVEENRAVSAHLRTWAHCVSSKICVCIWAL